MVDPVAIIVPLAMIVPLAPIVSVTIESTIPVLSITTGMFTGSWFLTIQELLEGATTQDQLLSNTETAIAKTTKHATIVVSTALRILLFSRFIGGK